MRICYLSQSYVPSRRASSIQVMNMCSAWAGQGHDVLLATKHCPPRQEPGAADDYAFYGVEANFEIAKLTRPSWRGGGLVYAWGLDRMLRREAGPTDLFFCRDPTAASHAARRACPFVFEAHVPPQSPRLTKLHRRFLASPSCLGLVVISKRLGEYFEDQRLVGPNVDAIVAPDAAVSAPEKPSIPSVLASATRPRIGYVGQLYSGKGQQMLVQLARRLPRASFHLVGGDEDRLAALRSADLPDNLYLHGFVPPAELHGYQAGFDIVVMPYGRRVSGASGQSDLTDWMSPLKMFEYMAAGKAIVSADLPVLREVLRHEENALLVPPEETEAWAASLQRLADDEALRERLGDVARLEATAKYSWEARARRILDGLKLDGS